jgi:hypothetical protein
MNRYKPIGWRGESYRHALARRGIKTKVDYAKDLDIFKSHQKRIAIDTLRMPDAMVGVFTYGSRYAMDKNKARSFLKSIRLKILRTLKKQTMQNHLLLLSMMMVLLILFGMILKMENIIL